MVYQGTVRGGVVVLDPGLQLPDGIIVTVQPHLPSSRETAAAFPLRNSIPVFPRQESAQPVTVELVSQLNDETP
jgi:hypothetical protein